MSIILQGQVCFKIVRMLNKVCCKIARMIRNLLQRVLFILMIPSFHIKSYQTSNPFVYKYIYCDGLTPNFVEYSMFVIENMDKKSKANIMIMTSVEILLLETDIDFFLWLQIHKETNDHN